MGLFDFGKKQRLLEMQRIVIVDAPPDKLIASEQWLLNEMSRMAQRDLDIINDCIRIVKQTKDPDVFFGRLNLIAEKADKMRVHCKYLNFSGADPTLAYANYWAERQECIFQFLERCYNDIKNKSHQAKTPKGKLSKYQNFVERLHPYYSQLDPRNMNYVEIMFGGAMRQLSS